jgi:hypothetical protein
MWTNQEIGVQRAELITPATIEKEGQQKDASKHPPHWAYGNPQHLKPEEIGVRTETPVKLPLDWFPKCTYCEGTGLYPIIEIAKARGQTLDQIKAWLSLQDPNLFHYDPSKDTVRCTACNETGHVDRHVTVGLKKGTWGYEMYDTGRKRAERICKQLKDKHGPVVQYYWEGIGNGRAELKFYTETIVPFTLE